MRELNVMSDLIAYVRSGNHPVVEFKQQHDLYVEKGMRARITLAEPSYHSVVSLVFNFEEFDAHNRPLERSRYLDASRQPRLSAREAGYYSPTKGLYFEPDTSISDELDLVEDNGAQLYQEFLENKDGAGAYVTWLEQQLMAARKG